LAGYLAQLTNSSLLIEVLYYHFFSTTPNHENYGTLGNKSWYKTPLQICKLLIIGIPVDLEFMTFENLKSLAEIACFFAGSGPTTLILFTVFNICVRNSECFNN
jgi:hypothetical protein